MHEAVAVRDAGVTAWRRHPALPLAVLLTLAIGAACAPLLLVSMPPLADYPNHLARMMVLAHLPAGGLAWPSYRQHWSLVPDLGMDLLVPPLLRFMSPEAAGRLLLACIVAGWTGGAVFLSASLHRRASAWAVTAAFSAWNLGLLMGFVNNALAVTAALWAAGAWLRLRERARHPVALAALGAAGGAMAAGLFVLHLSGAILFCVVLGADALVRLARAARGSWRERVRAAGAAAANLPAPVTLIVLYAAARVSGVGAGPVYPRPGLLIAHEFAAWSSNLPSLDVITGLAILAVLATARRVRVSAVGVVALVVLAALGLALPDGWHGTWWVDVRFQIMAGLFLSIAVQPEWGGHGARRATVLLGGLGAFRLAVMAWLWSASVTLPLDVRALVALVPRDAAVLSTNLRQPPPRLSAWFLDGGQPTDYQLPAWAAVARGMAWSGLFDDPAQQSIVPRRAEARLQRDGEAVAVWLAHSAPGGAPQSPPPEALARFDWLVATGAWGGAPACLLDDAASLVEQRQGVALYRIIHAGPPCGAPPPLVNPALVADAR
jgi:hypothetical protein